MGLRRVGATAVLAVSLLVSGATPAIATTGARALWVWDEPRSEIVGFAAANGITDVYIHAPPGFSDDARFSGFIAAAHSKGIAVQAMAGDPAWARDGGAWTGWVEEVVAHGGFDGVVFDVEPYVHPDWGTRKQSRLIRSYLAGLDSAVGAAGGLPALAAVPFWFDEVRVKRDTLLDRVVAASDGIVVMAYRDHAEGVDGIIDVSSTEAALASSMGRIFVIGVETGPALPEKVTFAEEGRTFMENELAIVAGHYGLTDGFGGIAVHHYGSYSTMTP